MIEIICGKKINVEKNDYGKKYYSFKDVCDLLDIESKDRTNLGRKIRQETIKIQFKNKNGTIKDKTYCNINAVVIMCDFSDNKKKNKIIKAFRNYNENRVPLWEKILKIFKKEK